MRSAALFRLSLVSILLILLGAACSSAGEKEFPSFVYASSRSLQSYQAAVALPSDVLTKMPCYCGCVTLDKPHMSLRDCFFNEDETYSDHAVGCDLCGRIVLDVQKMHKEGKDLGTIRATIDSTYSSYGAPTNTPPVTSLQ